jgi:tRNA threonylcarbamoyladenosine biosynthesis protein TsaB
MSGMILALTTSGPEGGVGLATAGGDLVGLAAVSGRSRGRDLAPAIRDLLAGAGAAPADLSRIVVDVGPGSFTGVRVGVATAKGLAFALSLPVVAVVSLDVLAAAAGAAEDDDVVALRDAGRGTYYHALYGPGAGAERPRRHEPARSDGDAVRAAAGPARAVGEDAPALAGRIGLSGAALTVVATPQALLAAATGLAAQPVHAIVPLYLQDSAAERRRVARGR